MENCTISDEQMKEIYKRIGKNVKRIREENKISQLSLALLIGHKAVGVISNSELCLQNKHFNIEHLVKIANVLEVDLNEFFTEIIIK
ncbi:helix-turn-helix domain-containing protein [Poseidonibacter ostreae]|uniref:XRE family transcriptional regulator n=1 Tax=Poseidonibacter ostreae TaxID=2654171 RepID=A0ABQ6VLQ4_9BACT|nr:helix-turn-helix transcriptional regulator [Poseidonibacter ostreae]KAB7891527.1 XRE family transcriptional regulator [Poseidonibacter ostreae]